MTELLSQTTRKALKKNSLVVNEDGTPKMGRAFFYIGGMLMLMAALLVWVAPAMAEEALPAEAASGVETDAKSAPCKGLKPFNNIDELLYQFYVNLDSDCLFEMPTAELEKIWGIKILDEERAKPKNYYPLSKTDFYNKPYRSEKDAFYIEVVRAGSGMNAIDADRFFIRLTKEYSASHGQLFPKENLNEMLFAPKAIVCDKYKCTYKSSDRARTIVILKPGHTARKYGEIIISRQYTRQEIESFSFEDSLANSVNNAAAADKPTSTERALEDSGVKTALCRDLKPFTSIEELLYQFYINLDSDCLFTMPKPELEKLWRVEMYHIDWSKQHPESVEQLNAEGMQFYYKPYKMENDAVCLNANQGKMVSERKIFTIKVTQEYLKTHDSLFHKNRFFKPLPMPIEKFDLADPCDSGKYYWFNSNKTHRIIWNDENGISEIIIY